MAFFAPFAFRKPRVIGGYTPTDSDAIAFLDATGITDPTIEQAIDTLVIDLKSYGIWSQMYAIYPFVGGTATTHKYNLKDPRDLDAAYRLVFSGGITHSSTGVKGNGSTGYYNTKLVSTTLGQNDVSMGTYTRDNIAEEKVDIGYLAFSPSIRGLQLNTRNTSDQIFVRIHAGTTQAVSNSDARGLISVNRTSSTTQVVSKNSTQTSASVSSLTLPTLTIYGLCFNLNGSPDFYSTREQAFSFIGQGLSDTELDNYYTAVQAFQTTLGRQV